jgi:cysteine sulfinate desulfinase/cysteine desulfurase-like protein
MHNHHDVPVNAELASGTEFNINAIDKDQRGSVDLTQFKDQISSHQALFCYRFN